MASRLASVSLRPTRGQPKFRYNGKSNKRTDRNKVDQERARSSNFYTVACRFVTVDDEWVCDALHLVSICNVQYDAAYWTMSIRLSLVEFMGVCVPYQIYVDVNVSPRESLWNGITF